MVVSDDQRCIVDLLVNLTEFDARESCGWCTPCWSGTQWLHDLVRRVEAREGTPEAVDTIEHLCASMTPATCFCAHGPSATRHVVADPRADVDPWVGCAIDWDATLAYRRHLWRLGLGESWEQALVWAAAVSAASVLTDRTSIVNPTDVDRLFPHVQLRAL